MVVLETSPSPSMSSAAPIRGRATRTWQERLLVQQQGGGGRDDGDSDDSRLRPQTGTHGYKPPQPEPWVRPPQSFGEPPEPWKDRPHVFDVFSFGMYASI